MSQKSPVKKMFGLKTKSKVETNLSFGGLAWTRQEKRLHQIWVKELLATLQASHHTFQGVHNRLLRLFSSRLSIQAWGLFSRERMCAHIHKLTQAFMFCLHSSPTLRVMAVSARRIKTNPARLVIRDKSSQNYTSMSLSQREVLTCCAC